jgi:hypothetical protein
MSWSTITVVEKRDVLTRICVGCADRGAEIHRALFEQREARGWLSVSLQLEPKQPKRSQAELRRASKLVALVGRH